MASETPPNFDIFLACSAFIRSYRLVLRLRSEAEMDNLKANTGAGFVPAPVCFCA
jgi:hypothetical protein